MTDVTVAATEHRPAKRAEDKPKSLRVQGKLVVALKAIVHEGQELAEAAATAGLTTHAVRCALSRPHVIAFLKREREILRAYVSAQNIHHARELRNTTRNATAKVAVMKYIDDLDIANRSVGSSMSQMPGFTIVLAVHGNITGAHSEHMRETEAKPLITQGRDILHENMSEPGGRGEKSPRFARSPP